MRRTRWLIFLWPGLPGLWLRGSWPWLAVAVAAGVLLNLVLLGSFEFSEWIAPGWLGVFWLATVLVWSAGVVAAGRQRLPVNEDADEHTFERALVHYLKGDWFQAERLLLALLKQTREDAEARLTLATLYRHVGRYDDAESQLDSLLRTDGATKWEWEIRRERQLLSEAASRADGRTQDDEPGDSPAKAANAA